MQGLIDLNGSGKLTLDSVNVSCCIENLFVGCRSCLVYKNNTNKKTEGIFLFPIKKHYEVIGIECDVDGNKFTGQCKEMSEAKQMNQMMPQKEQKKVVVGPESNGRDSFNFRINSIPKDSTIKIFLKLLIHLKLNALYGDDDRDQFSLFLPSILKPCCYQKGKDNTTELYYVSNQYSYSFEANLIGNMTVMMVSSSRYVLSLTLSETNNCKAKVILKSKYDGKYDFDINIDYKKKDAPLVLYQYGTSSKNTEKTNPDDFRKNDLAVVNFISKVDLKKMEFVLLLDISGSPSGFDAEVAQQCISLFLMNLPDECTFQIYKFGLHFDKLFMEPQVNNDKSFKQATNFSKNIKTDSEKTDVVGPVKDMYSFNLSDEYFRIAFLVTDGDLTIDDEFVQFIKENNHSTIFNSICIGDIGSSSFIEKLTKCGPLITAIDIEEVISSLDEIFKSSLKLHEFTVDNIIFNCPSGVSVETVVSDPESIQTNKCISAFCTINGEQEDKKLTGQFTLACYGESRTYPIDLNREDGVYDEESTVHTFLAKCNMNQMLFDIEKGDHKKKDALIKLSLETNIKTKYTTLVSVDEKSPDRGLFVSEFLDPEEFYKPVFQVDTAGKSKGDDELSMKIWINDEEKDWERKDKLEWIAEKQHCDGHFPADPELIWIVKLEQPNVEKYQPEHTSLKTWMTTLVFNDLTSRYKHRKNEWQLVGKKAKKMIIKDITENKNKEHSSHGRAGDIDNSEIKKVFKELTTEACLVLEVKEDQESSKLTDTEIVNVAKKDKEFEIVFVVDRSGSMQGSKIECTKTCMTFFITSLPSNCKFQIYGFGSKFDKLFTKCQPNNNKNKQKAMDYRNKIEANFGNTDLLNPLKDVYGVDLTKDFVRLLFVLTDGEVENKCDVLSLVRRYNTSTRVYAIGIGEDVSIELVNILAGVGLGEALYVRNESDLSGEVINLLNKAILKANT